MSATRVLIADDSRIVRASIVQHLKDRFDIREVTDGEAAWQAIRLSPEIRSFFERITHGQKQRRKIALVATAHWLARVMFAMLRTGEPARFTKFARPSKPARTPAKPPSAAPEKTAA